MLQSLSSSSLHGVVLVLLAAVLWGTTGTAHSLAPDGLSPYWVGALRLAMAGAFFVGLGCWLQRRQRAGHGPLDWPRTLWCAVCMVTYNLAFFAGLRHISAATSVALSKLEPVTAFALSILVVGESPSGLALGGLMLVLLGLWLVVFSEMRAPMHG